jgi:hypothetical protein
MGKANERGGATFSASPRAGEGAGRVQPRRWRLELSVLLVTPLAAAVGALIALLGAVAAGTQPEYSTLVVDR